MKNLLTILLLLFCVTARAQKVDSIFFNLYTDSLKKGVYNYINVDGKMEDGSFLPLMADEVVFKSSAGKWQGNSLIFDADLKEEKVNITATLKTNPGISKNITIYLKKINTEPELKNEKEVIDNYRKRKKG